MAAPLPSEAPVSRSAARMDDAPAMPASPPTPIAVAAAASGPGPRADDEARLAAYTRALSEAVAPHKQYPGVARIRGWQGTTLVEVNVGAAGKVVAARVLRTSGYEVLDRQAVDMIYRAAPLPVLPVAADRPGAGEILVRLPIQFTLVN